jgi:hypothetical protein
MKKCLASCCFVLSFLMIGTMLLAEDTQDRNTTTIIVVFSDQYAQTPVSFVAGNDIYTAKTLGKERTFHFTSLEPGKHYTLTLRIPNPRVPSSFMDIPISFVGGETTRFYVVDDASELTTGLLKPTLVRDYGLDLFELRKMSEKGIALRRDAVGRSLDWKAENKKPYVALVGNSDKRESFKREIDAFFRKSFNPPVDYRDYYVVAEFEPSDWHIRYDAGAGREARLPEGMIVFGERTQEGKAVVLHHQPDEKNSGMALLQALRRVDPQTADALEKRLLPDLRNPPKPPDSKPNNPEQPYFATDEIILGSGLGIATAINGLLVWLTHRTINSKRRPAQ